MKKICAVLILLSVLCGCAAAEVIPPYGMGQIGYQAVVLCQSLTVRSERSASSKGVATLRAGDLFATTSTVDGWADCYLSENSGRTGWVKADYIAVDPAWYIADAATPVYAWNERSAYRVALLDKGEKHPILKTSGDWLLIGLRGAAGWIEDARQAASAYQTVFSPGKLHGIVRAEVMIPDGSTYTMTDPHKLAWIEKYFSGAEQTAPGKCPFDAVLTLTLADGSCVSLDLASDSCAVYLAEPDLYYRFDQNSANFWALFGLKTESFY